MHFSFEFVSLKSDLRVLVMKAGDNVGSSLTETRWHSYPERYMLAIGLWSLLTRIFYLFILFRFFPSVGPIYAQNFWARWVYDCDVDSFICYLFRIRILWECIIIDVVQIFETSTVPMKFSWLVFFWEIPVFYAYRFFTYIYISALATSEEDPYIETCQVAKISYYLDNSCLPSGFMDYCEYAHTFHEYYICECTYFYVL